MDTSVLFSARAWAALIPLLVLIANALGVPFTEDMLATFGQKVASLFVSGLGFWSLVQANPIRPDGIGQLFQRRTWMVAIPLIVILSQAAGRPVDEATLTQLGDQLPLIATTLLAIVSKLRGDSAGTVAARKLVQ